MTHLKISMVLLVTSLMGLVPSVAGNPIDDADLIGRCAYGWNAAGLVIESTEPFFIMFWDYGDSTWHQLTYKSAGPWYSEWNMNGADGCFDMWQTQTGGQLAWHVVRYA